MREQQRTKFYQIAETTPIETLYPSEIPDALRATIYDFFYGREICSETDFIRFFRRTLKEHYPQYKAIFRLTEGISTYDYLVEKYQEEKRTAQETGTGTTSETATETGTIDETTSGQTGGTITKSGTSTLTPRVQETETKTATRTGQKVETPRVQTTTQTDGTIEYGQTATRTDDLQSVTDEDRDERTQTGEGTTATQTAKNAPMSITLAGGATGGNAPANGTASLTPNSAIAGELQYATAISLSAGNSAIDTKATADNSTTQRDTGTQTTATGGEDTSTQTVTQSRTGIDTTDESETESVSVQKSKTGEDQTQTSATETRSGTASGTKGTETERTGTKSGEKTDEKSGEYLSVSTGRTTRISELLGDAVAFIERTDAWAFLRGKLEPCFFGIFDI